MWRHDTPPPAFDPRRPKETQLEVDIDVYQQMA